MQTENKETITIDDKNYIVEDLNEKQRYLVAQIKECKQKANMFHMQGEQMDMASKSYTTALVEDLKEKPEKNKEE